MQNLSVADGFTHKIIASVNLNGLYDDIALYDKTGEIYITQEASNKTLVILDTTVPRGSIIINGGDSYTTSTGVTLNLTYSDASSGVSQVRYSNDGVWDTEPWEKASANKAWTLASGDGTKTVYYQIRDNAGLLSPTYSDTLILDTTAHLITVTQGANGQISPSGNVSVNFGGSQSFNITASAGYHIVDVVVDSVSRGAVSSYTFTNVTSAHAISASFAINAYTITPSAGSNGAISPSTVQTVNYGGSQSFTITANTGYHIASLTVDGSSVATASSYAFSNVQASHTITATFTLIPTPTPTPTSPPTPTPSPSSTPSATTVSATTSSGAIVDLEISGNVTSSQISNVAIITNASATTTTLSFTVTGQSGATGFSNMTVPISAVPYGTSPIIYIDGQSAQDQGSCQDSSNYYLWYTTSFSIHEISIVFTAGSLVPEFSPSIILLLSIALVVSVALVFTLRKHKISKTER